MTDVSTSSRVEWRGRVWGTALTLPAPLRREMARPAAEARASAVVLVALAALLLPGVAGRESRTTLHQNAKSALRVFSF